MISTAVILAAGLGSRLKEKTAHQPKGFLKIDDVSLIERSIQKLVKIGISHIVIGTGYLKEQYETLAQTLSQQYAIQIKCIENPDYATTGSMATLKCCIDHDSNLLKQTILLLESDLLYEQYALTHLIHSAEPHAILGSGITQYGDEVYIQTNKQYELISMTKTPKNSADCHAVLVGITKLSPNVLSEMVHIFNTINKPELHYEDALVEVSKNRPIPILKVDELTWCEIDDTSHLEMALSTIYPKIKLKDQQAPIHRNILLNPGPATTTDSVKYAQVVPDICPRESDFGQLIHQIDTELTAFVANPHTHTAILMGGSGTAGMESVISTVVPPNKQLVIVNNGAYGKRMLEIAKIYNIPVSDFQSPPDQAIDIAQLKSHIQNQSIPVSHLAVVHHETTTGLLNDLTPIGKLAKELNIELIVDAISSYAAIPIQMDTQNIHYLVASSNKNIQGMAGIVFIIAEKNRLEKLSTLTPRNFYLNLYQQFKSIQSTHQFQFTPPVQTVYALWQAIIETKQEGIANRYQRYIHCWTKLKSTLDTLNLSYLVEDKHHGKLITAIRCPDTFDFDHFHIHCYRQGITIYPGKLGNTNTFRIANIGQITIKDMEKVCTLLTNYFTQ